MFQIKIKNRQKFNLIPVVFFALGMFFNLATTSHAKAAEDSQFFPETGKTVSGKFLQYWRANGGLPVYGYPITEAQSEVDPETGKTFLTQWFERNRFEYHPENVGTKYEILLGLLGKDLKREALVADQTFVAAAPLVDPASPANEQIYFKETGHNLRGLFYKYWRENGGLEKFGYPISEQQEAFEAEAQGVFLTQWFERARFEYHPENKPPYNVLLGLLGKQIKNPPKATSVTWTVGLNPYSIHFSTGIVVDSQNNIYVAEDSNRLLKYDRNLHLVNIIGQFTSNTSWLDSIKKVRLDSQNNVYISKGLKYLAKYSSNGQLLQEFENLAVPSLNDFAVAANGDFYVTNTDAVYKFDASGKFLLKWQSSEPDKTFGRIIGITLDSNDNVYIADQLANKLIKFDSQGKYLASREVLLISASTDFHWELDKDGNIYFQPFAASYNLLKLDQFGKQSEIKLGHAITDFAFDAQGNVYSSGYILSKQTPQNQVTTWGTASDDLLKFHVSLKSLRSDGLTTDKEGNVYLVDYFNSAIKKFNSKGQLLASWGKAGDQPGEFTFGLSTSIALDAAGAIYVADSNRIQKFDKTGRFIEIWGQSSPEAAKVSSVGGLAVDPNGYVYLTENNKVLKYDLNGRFLASWDTKNHPLSGDVYKLTVDRQGNIYVLLSVTPSTDGVSRFSVQKYDFTGRFLLSFVAAVIHPSSSTPLYVSGISVDTQGNVYISRDDSYYHPGVGITKISSDGATHVDIVGFSIENPRSEHPSAVAVSSDGSIYIYDRELGLQKVRLP